MATIRSKVLFVTTSPRTPAKMIPEIELLNRFYSGKVWNSETQKEFMETLRDEDFFNGVGSKDLAFSARDRINRAPKSFGFVNLKPTISLTPAGRVLMDSNQQEEIFLRQLLKFQIPSPYHKPTNNAATFYIKPYLELFRLIRHFGSLRFDELQIFGLQLTDYREFDNIVAKIEAFRVEKAKHHGSYKNFVGECFDKELRELYWEELTVGDTKTRESNDASESKFLFTKAQNMRDYADACFRYLRATGMVSISHSGRSISIAQEKIKDVDFFLETIDRNPKAFTDEDLYAEYLGNAEIPYLLTDNKEELVQKIHSEFPSIDVDINAPIVDIKDVYVAANSQRKKERLDNQIKEIKDYKKYDDIQNVFNQIDSKSLYDIPLMFEWNVWRAMTMLDGGNIQANLKFDDNGNPMSTAQGNMADIVCDYGDFSVAVEVTMSAGQKQYEMEGEPVSRHLGKLKKATSKPAFCFFIAPSINEYCVTHFYMLSKMNLACYGGTSNVIPLPVSVFRKMVEDSYKASYTPNPNQVLNLFKKSEEFAQNSVDEKEWYQKISDYALNWLQ